MWDQNEFGIGGILTDYKEYLLSTFHLNKTGVHKFYISPSVGGGDKIKGFGDGEEKQWVEKKKKQNFRRYYTFGSTKR